MTPTGFRLDDDRIHPPSLAAWALHFGRPIADPAALRARLGEGDLPTAVAEAAAARPDAPALRIGETSVTHGWLEDSAGRAAGALQRLGMGPERIVLLMADPSITTIVAYLGALRSGATVVLGHPGSTPDELRRLADAVAPRMAIGRGHGLRTAIEARLPSVDEFVGLGEDDRAHASAVLDGSSDDYLPARPLNPDQPAILAFTSGTTGSPKCAPLSHRNLLASIRAAMWAWQWSPHDHLVHCLPISHQHGLSGIHATLLAASQATVLGRFDADALLATVQEREATVMFAVPSIHARLLEELGSRVAELSSLRIATSGSAPLPIELAQRVQQATGQLPLERYGSTEAGLNVSNPLHGRRVPGAVGLALPGVEVCVISGEADVLPAGEPGEILVRGPQVFSGYRGVPSENDFMLDWFRTGDLGVVDPETGYLYIVGRSKDVIITGGMNVYPREVEDAIRSAGVTDVAVVGVPSERWGEEVIAVVAPAGLATESIAAAAAAVLAPYKRPKRIVAVPTIPRSATGKVDTTAVAKLVSS